MFSIKRTHTCLFTCGEQNHLSFTANFGHMPETGIEDTFWIMDEVKSVSQGHFSFRLVEQLQVAD